MATPVAAAPYADLVSNLGIFEYGDFSDTDDAAWDRHWQINVMASVRLARAHLPGMERQGWVRLILLSTEPAFAIPTEMIDYGVIKTADVALARGLAKRMAGTGVTVNSALPGATLTETVTSMIEAERAKSGGTFKEVAWNIIRSVRPSSIIRRAASVEEVAKLVVYVASPQASATTGAARSVDGGIIDTL